ncbi:MAG: 50S ribosomal protein L11 methyltransferase [Acidobacteria bacterium]|nr:50S ribosomal protein L11 methyltransferase [Acidobacteriota bacterium]
MHAFRVTVPEVDEDRATALLWEAGTAGIEVAAAPGGRTALLAYFPAETSLAALEETLADATIEAVAVPEVDWVARFRETFRAFRVGGFAVAPPWDRPADDGNLIVVDPGRAFGTGTHESTRLCLGVLEDLAGARALGRVIDVGTGTGILGVAALRLGARLAVATDIDPDATASAIHHATLNRAPLRVVRGDGAGPFCPGAFDVVLANLTAPLLVTHATSIAGLRRRGGALVLSGLLDSDRPEVQAAYGACGPFDVRLDGEWAALVYRGQP